MSTLKPSKYIDLQPFQAWVQQSLPAVYDDSLSYTDLLAKMLAYLNNLVANNNTLSTDVTNAINYINTFFESTDFQDKVDDKLNRMAEDGSLSRLIQPLFDVYKVQIDSEVATQNTSISNIQSQQTILKERMDTFTQLPSGSTSGDAELHDIRVGANGVTYSTAGDAVRGQYSQLKEELAYGFIQKNFEVHKGTFISDNGQYVTNDGTTNFAYSSPIPVNNGDIVKFTATGYLNYVAMISFVDDKGNILKIHEICQDSNEHTYTLTIFTDGYIAVSFDFTKKHMLFINDNKIEKLDNKIDNLNNLSNLRYPKYTLTFNQYVQAHSNILESDGSCYSSPISLKADETIVLNAMGYLDNVAMISTCDADGNNINMVVRSSGNELKKYSYHTDVDTYVIISYLYTGQNSVKIIKEVNEEELEYVNLSLFNKFGVIGDSYASGELWYGENYSQHKDEYPVSWGQILARTLGTNCTNYSSGGLTTRSWLTAEKGLSLLNSSEPEDIYYLALGINDWYALGENYLGIENDMETKADTFYGNYAKIIEAVRTHAPHAKLIMFTMADTGTLQQKFNNAIINIAKHYGLPYIIQANDEYFKSHIYLDMTNGHPRATGYAGMANAFERLIKKCILKYYDYFKDSFMY